jgi:hypothetical protein
MIGRVYLDSRPDLRSGADGHTFVAAVGHPVSKQEAVQMGLLTPDLQPAPATQLAHNLRSAPLPQPQSETGTVGLAKPGPKEIELSR